jgi:hypothetical protein
MEKLSDKGKMIPISKDDLQRLMQVRDQCCISIFMPTHSDASEIEQDQIRLKNLIRQAEQRIDETALSPESMRTGIEKSRRLLQEMAFRRPVADGLALFLSPEHFISYSLPLKFEELLVAANRFHVKPLLPLFSSDGRFYVLAISQNAVRMIVCTRFSAMEIDLPELDGGLSKVLDYDDTGKELQFHTGTAEGGDRRSAMFHGHGVGVDDAKDEILQYFRKIDEVTWKVLQTETAPLVLAGVDYLLPLYRSVTSYGNPVDDGIQGNPDGLSVETLHAKALEIVQTYFTKSQEDAAARLQQKAGTGLASGDLSEIVPAAAQGRVDTAIVAKGQPYWGVFDAVANEVTIKDDPTAGSEDLLNLIAVETLLNGGRVYVVDAARVPLAGPAAALFRF